MDGIQCTLGHWGQKGWCWHIIFHILLSRREHVAHRGNYSYLQKTGMSLWEKSQSPCLLLSFPSGKPTLYTNLYDVFQKSRTNVCSGLIFFKNPACPQYHWGMWRCGHLVAALTITPFSSWSSSVSGRGTGLRSPWITAFFSPLETTKICVVHENLTLLS